MPAIFAGAAAATSLADVERAFEARMYLTASHAVAELLPTLEGAERDRAQRMLARAFAALGLDEPATAVLDEAANAAPDDTARAPSLELLAELRAQEHEDLAEDLADGQRADLLVERAEAGDVTGAEALLREVARTDERARAVIALAAARWAQGDERAAADARRASARADEWRPEGFVLAAEIPAERCTARRDDRLAEARTALASSDDPGVEARLRLDPEVRDHEVRIDRLDWQRAAVALQKDVWRTGPAGEVASRAIDARLQALEADRDADLERARARIAELRDALADRLDAAADVSAACP